MGIPPIAGWFMMENRMKMDDDFGVPIFQEPPKMGEDEASLSRHVQGVRLGDGSPLSMGEQLRWSTKPQVTWPWVEVVVRLHGRLKLWGYPQSSIGKWDFP